jgi:hypothetical protein
MKKLAPEHVARNTLKFDDYYHVSSEYRYITFQEYGFILCEEIHLVGIQQRYLDELKPSLKRVRGMTIGASMNRLSRVYYDTSKGKKTPASFSEKESFLLCPGHSNHYDKAYSTVLTAMLQGKTISEVKDIYPDFHNPFHVEPENFLMFNPTMKRAEEAAVDLQRFWKYAQRKKGLLCEIANCVVYADGIESRIDKCNSEARRFGKQERKRMLAKADELYSRMEVPNFSRLEDKAAHICKG